MITRPGGRTREFLYDATGNVAMVRDERSVNTWFFYDKRNQLETVSQIFDATRVLRSRYIYDPVGNLKKMVSPKAWDASPETIVDRTTFSDYVTEYGYDKANRLITVMLPSRGTEQRHYVHRAYDDGNVVKTSAPVVVPPTPDGSWPAVPKLLTTTASYFRNGWIQSIDDGANPLTTYDYTPEGWQTSRSIGPDEDEHWRYNPDGSLKIHERRDQTVTYEYDGNGNVSKVIDGLGKNDAGRDNLEIRVVHNGFDEIAEVRHQDQARPDDDANWTFTTYTYDLNGNVAERIDDGTKGADGVVRGRRHTFSYNDVDWLTAHRDWGKASDCTDDQWTDNDYLPNGLQEFRVIKKASSSCTLSPDQPNWAVKQGTKWTYALNGDLTNLITKRSDPRVTGGAPDATTIESHTVEYQATIDGKTLYMNGHRTRDTFTLSKSGHPCAATACKLEFTYDARDRLRIQKRTLGNGTVTEKTWDLDPAGNVTREVIGPTERTFTYDGTRLRTLTSGGATYRHLYDGHGNVDCVVKNAYTGSVCPGGGQDLVTDYTYDAFDRLKNYQSLGSDGIVDDSAAYDYDVLDRVVQERETHPGFRRNVDFAYVGLTDQVATEIHDDPTSATPTARDVTKSYSYDPFGLRLSLTNTPAVPGSPGVGKAGTFTYAYDVHGSVSALVDAGWQRRGNLRL